MTNGECIEIYRELVQMMFENGMRWIVDLTEQEFITRETISETISYDHLNEENLNEDEEIYTPQKRLEALIDAIEQSVVNVASINHYITTFFQEHGKANEIKFQATTNTERSYVLRHEETTNILANASKLKILLEQLRRQI